MDNKVKCPSCGNEFELEHAFLNEAKKEAEALLLEREQKLADRTRVLKEQFEKEKRDIDLLKLNQQQIVDAKIAEEKPKLLAQLNQEIMKQFTDKLAHLQDELAKKNAENQQLRKLEVDIMKKDAEIKNAQEEALLIAEKKVQEERNKIKEEEQKRAEERMQMEKREFEKKLEDQKKLIEEMKRKAEQGSMQMQGEVQELLLEELLKHLFPFDTIDEVTKGQRGADVLQTVINANQQLCGKIVYESKRTKAFGGDWIEKLKEDQRQQQADLAVIVTETMPKELDRFGRIDGVWICSFNEVKSVAYVLREMLIKTNSMKLSQENKGDKMEMLYNYLSGNEFKQTVEAIVEGFTAMKEQLDYEKRAMNKIWKEREKQIEKVILNTSEMYGSIKGIAGNSIGNVKALELPFGGEE